MQNILMETVQSKTTEIEILKQRNEDQFKCALNDPLATQSMELPQQSEEHVKLESNLKEMKLLVNNLNNFDSQSIQELNEHCQEQKRLVESATELKIKNLENKSKKRKYNDETNNQEENIDQMNTLSKELIEIIDNYNLTCVKEFSNKINTIKASFSQLAVEVNTFLDNKQPINEDEIKIFNLESIQLQSKLHKELNKTKDLIFNKNKIEFINETDESTPLGYFDYDECFKVGYFYFSIFFINFLN
jgi:hypothetical protein